MADNAHDTEVGRRVMIHEARVHQMPGRELRDLRDGWLLHDPGDPEPYWNRLVAPRWPTSAASFERRLDEVLTLFATLDRIAHVRPLPLGNEPIDITARLLANGFEALAADVRLVLVDPEPIRRVLASHGASLGRPTSRLTVARYPIDAGRRVDGRPAGSWPADAGTVLIEAFAVDPLRRAVLQGDLLASGLRRGCSILVIYDDGVPVATARRMTLEGATYLSSIGTRPAWRGQGLGALATALVVGDALADPGRGRSAAGGAPLVHLAVEASNEPARRLYERLGFAVLGEPVPDLLAL